MRTGDDVILCARIAGLIGETAVMMLMIWLSFTNVLGWQATGGLAFIVLFLAIDFCFGVVDTALHIRIFVDLGAWSKSK